MRAAVVSESWFGNTQKVAKAIAEVLRSEGEVVLLTVDDPPPSLAEVDLLVVGAPTHVHGLSTAMSRKSALEQRAEPGSVGIGVRGWLRQLPPGEGRRAAVFDTRIDKSVVLVGSAARGIAKRLERRGYELVAPSESFFVLDAAGPLKEGEIGRAADWAKSLATSTLTPAG
jgi:Flavodoxin domain